MPVTVPDEKSESIRDLERARDDAKQDETRARHRLGKFLLRHERRWTGKTNWTKGHMEWIRQQTFEHEAQNQVLREYLRKLDRGQRRPRSLRHSHRRRRQGMDARAAGQGLPGSPRGQAAHRHGDRCRGRRHASLRMPRSTSCRSLASFPLRTRVATSTHRGPITRTGNKHLRRVLVEAAWSYRIRRKDESGRSGSGAKTSIRASRPSPGRHKNGFTVSTGG